MNRRLNVLAACGVLALSLFLAAPAAQAAPIYNTSALGELTGSRSEGAGLTVGGNYLTDGQTFQVAWDITAILGGYRYEYTITGFGAPAISHLILDLSDDCTATNGCVTNLTFSAGAAGALEYGTFGPAPSNPNFPASASITGVKFDDTEGVSPWVITFDSDRAPVYGDIYFKSGRDSSAYNDGLADHTSDAVIDFIARPNGAGLDPQEPVPEPATLILFGSAIIGIAVMKRRRQQKS